MIMRDLFGKIVNPMLDGVPSITDSRTIAFTSVTVNISTIDGLALVTNPSINISRYLGWKLTVYDGTNTAVGWIKSAGVTETYSSNIILTPDFATDTNWTKQAGWTIPGTGVAVATLNNSFLYQSVAQEVGALYVSSFDLVSRNQGDITLYHSGDIVIANKSTLGTHSVKRTATGNPINWALYGSAGVTFDGTVDNGVHKKILTPSISGAVIVSAQGGTTQSWSSNTGIDANTASFTFTLSKT